MGGFFATTSMRARANTIIYRSTRSFAQLASLPLKRRSTLDHFLLTTAERHGLKSNEIPKLLQQYELNRSRELRLVLQSEPHPTEDRKIRPSMEKSSVVLVAHIAKNSQEFRVCVSTGFAINVNNSGSPLFLTCAHTLEVRMTNSPWSSHFDPLCRKCNFQSF